MSAPAEQLEVAIRVPRAGPVALVAQLVGGRPRRAGFSDVLAAVGAAADALVVVAPFSHPLPDGVTDLGGCRDAVAAGVTLRGVLSALDRAQPRCPTVLCSAMNPLLAYGLRRAVRAVADVGGTGLLVPDLPLEERAALQPLCAEYGLALVPVVAPTTPAERVRRLAGAGGGFVYATAPLEGVAAPKAYLERVRAAAALPVCAAMDVGTREHVAGLVGHADGAVVSAALAAALARGDDPGAFLADLVPDELGDPVPTEAADLPPR